MPASEGPQLLSQATGYGLICGLSVLFCIIILVAVRLQKWYLSEDSDQSEMVKRTNSFQRSIKS
jgi:hypothetical protein